MESHFWGDKEESLSPFTMSPRALILGFLFSVALFSGGCTQRDPYVTMCGVAIDLEVGRQATSDGLAERNLANQSKVTTLTNRARTSLSAADDALRGIGTGEMQSDATWRALTQASSQIHTAVDRLSDGSESSMVTEALDAATASLGEATKVIPKGCVTT